MVQPFDFADLVEEASERAGGDTTTATEVYSLQRSLYLIQQDWQQKNFPTWRVTTDSFVTDGYSPYIVLPDCVDDVMQVNSTVNDMGEMPMRRISPAEYAQLTTKDTQGRPSMYYLQRSEPAILYIYPIGNPGAEVGLEVMYIARPPEFERYQPNSEVPGRWTRALVQALALELAKKRPPYNEALIQRLTAEKEQAEELAKRDDRGRQRYRVRMAR